MSIATKTKLNSRLPHDWAKIDRNKPKSNHTYMTAVNGKDTHDLSKVHHFRMMHSAKVQVLAMKQCFICVLALKNKIEPDKPKLLILVSASEKNLLVEKKWFTHAIAAEQMVERHKFLKM